MGRKKEPEEGEGQISKEKAAKKDGNKAERREERKDCGSTEGRQQGAEEKEI